MPGPPLTAESKSKHSPTPATEELVSLVQSMQFSNTPACKTKEKPAAVKSEHVGPAIAGEGTRTAIKNMHAPTPATDELVLLMRSMESSNISACKTKRKPVAVTSERVDPAAAGDDSRTAIKRKSRPYQDEQDLPMQPTSQRVPESSEINLISVRRELTALAVKEVVHAVNNRGGMQNALEFYTAKAQVYDKNITARTLLRCVYASFMDDIDYASLNFSHHGPSGLEDFRFVRCMCELQTLEEEEQLADGVNANDSRTKKIVSSPEFAVMLAEAKQAGER